MAKWNDLTIQQKGAVATAAEQCGCLSDPGELANVVRNIGGIQIPTGSTVRSKLLTLFDEVDNRNKWPNFVAAVELHEGAGTISFEGFKKAIQYAGLIVDELLNKATDTYDQEYLKFVQESLVLFEHCKAELRNGVRLELLQDAVKRARVCHPHASHLDDLEPDWVLCLKDLIAAPGAPGVYALEAFLTGLQIADKPEIKAWLVARRKSNELTETYTPSTVAERDEAGVVSIVLSPAKEISGGECNVRIRCYPPRSNQPLAQDFGDGQGVQPRQFVSDNLTKALNLLAGYSDDIRIEFIVPTPLLGEEYDQWTFSYLEGTPFVCERGVVVVRWIENAATTSAQERFVRIAKSKGVEWVPDPTLIPCPVLTKLENDFRRQEAKFKLLRNKTDPFPIGLLLSEVTVNYNYTYWRQAIQLGLPAIWIREHQSPFAVKDDLQNWIDELDDLMESNPEIASSRHEILPRFVHLKRNDETNALANRIQILWENPQHFATVGESAQIKAAENRSRFQK